MDVDQVLERVRMLTEAEADALAVRGKNLDALDRAATAAMAELIGDPARERAGRHANNALQDAWPLALRSPAYGEAFGTVAMALVGIICEDVLTPADARTLTAPVTPLGD